VSVRVLGGRIVWYKKSNDFEAICGEHKSCTMKRRSIGNPAFPAQGRPLGQLNAWVMKSTTTCKASKAVHTHDANKPTPDERDFGRRALKLTPGSKPLFTHERKKRKGEGSEPETEP